MFSRIKAWIVGEVRTVEGIVSTFTNTIRQLEVHAVSKVSEAVRHEATAAEATVKAEEAKTEASKAFKVADQIKQLVA
jgi:hypothetical protein